jgi:hypothetical protein
MHELFVPVVEEVPFIQEEAIKGGSVANLRL